VRTNALLLQCYSTIKLLLLFLYLSIVIAVAFLSQC